MINNSDSHIGNAAVVPSIARCIMNVTVAAICILSAFVSYDAGNRSYCFLSMTLGLGNIVCAIFSIIDIIVARKKEKK